MKTFSLFLITLTFLSTSASYAANEVCFVVDGQIAKFETRNVSSPTSFKISSVDALENWSNRGNLISVVRYNDSTIFELTSVVDSHVFYSALIVGTKKVTFTTRILDPQTESFKRVNCQ